MFLFLDPPENYLYRMAISLLIHVHGRNMMDHLKHAELKGNQCQPRLLNPLLVKVSCFLLHVFNPESSSTELFGTAFLLKINPFRRLLNVYNRGC